MAAEHSDAFPPLEDGEYILLRGRYGGPAKYMWSGTFGALALVFTLAFVLLAVQGKLELPQMIMVGTFTPTFAILAAIPWLRSGRYRLTNRFLHFKPTIGETKSARLAEVHGIDDVQAHKQGLRVRAPGVTIQLRNVTRWQQLWGALLLYRMPGMADPLPPAQGLVPHLRLRCAHQRTRTSFGWGTLILRPDRATYLPDGSEVDAVKQAVGAVAGGGVALHAKLPTLEYAEKLATAGEAMFDARISELRERTGGIELAPGELPGEIRPFRLWPSRTLVRLREGTRMFQGSCPTPLAEAQASWLAAWRGRGANTSAAA